jgi:hypothetical protein
MNIKECVEKSLYILSEYYNNRIEPYFEHLADNVIWHGPAIGQQITGRETMRKAWYNEPNHLTFSLGNVEAQYIQLSPASCEVMMMFVVTTHYPNGDMIPLFQRIQFSWADTNIINENSQKERVSRIFMIHISNPVEQHSDDFIYPEHYNELFRQVEKPVQEPRLSLRGTDNAFYVIKVSSVIWVQTTPDQHCLFHLRERMLKVKTTLSDIERQTEKILIRVHSGFIVNPLDVVSVSRFKLTLSDGASIPVPEKKYTAVKKKLLEYNNALSIK